MSAKRLLLAMTGVYVARAVARRSGLVCALRGQHEGQRQLIGGWRCGVCQAVGVDLQDMGLQDDGYVSPVRKTFSSEHGGTVTRTSSWEKEIPLTTRGQRASRVGNPAHEERALLPSVGVSGPRKTLTQISGLEYSASGGED